MLVLERIKNKPKKDKSIAEKTMDNVRQAMKQAQPQVDAQVPYKVAPHTAPEQLQQTEPQVVEQTPIATVQPPTSAKIAENNKIVGQTATGKVPQVDANYVQPSPVEFGAKYTPEQQQKDLADPTKGYYYVAQQLARETAYEGQDEIDKRNKREQQRSLISSIADGLSSIANLGGTMAGGVSQNLSSMSEANMKRREYQRSLRDKEKDKWQTMMMRTGEMQQNYELAKDKQAFMNEKRMADLQIKELELGLKSARTQGDIDKIYAQIDKIYGDLDRRERELGVRIDQFNETVRKNERQNEIGRIKAGASSSNAATAKQRADEAERHNREIEKLRASGTTNSGTPVTSSAFTPHINQPATEQPPTPTKQPAKQTPTNNTTWLGKDGLNTGDNKKHKQNPFK